MNLDIEYQIEPRLQPLQVVRHADVKAKLRVSSAKLFDMVAKGQFPKPFQIIPGGRAVGWLAGDVDAWIVERSQAGTSS